MTTGKTIALSRWTFAGKVMSLLFNMLSRLVITFLPRSKHLFFSWLQSPSAVILEPRKIKSVTVSLMKNFNGKIMKILLVDPWTAGRSNQSILKEISPGCSNQTILKEISPGCLLEGLMLKLKLQNFSHLMRRADSFEKTLMLVKIEGRRRRG